VLFEGLDEFVDGDEESVLGYGLLDDGGVAVRTEDLLIGVVFEERLYAGGATAVLVHAHHHGSVVLGIELPHAEEALHLDLAFQQTLDFFGHALAR